MEGVGESVSLMQHHAAMLSPSQNPRLSQQIGWACDQLGKPLKSN